MKSYKIGSAAYKRQKTTQRQQRIAAERPTPEKRTGQKYLHPGRRDENGRMKEI